MINGGAGFIGSHLAERLLRDGRAVVVLDNFDPFYDPEVKERNLAAAKGVAGFRLVRGEIRDPSALDDALAEPADLVVHLAAKAGVRPSLADPVGYASVNVDGTVQVLEAVRRHGVRRLIFGSSSSVYGNNRKVPFSESDPVDEPVSPYAATKRAGELLCRAHHHLHRTDVACLRFFTVYGPWGCHLSECGIGVACDHPRLHEVFDKFVHTAPFKVGRIIMKKSDSHPILHMGR